MKSFSSIPGLLITFAIMTACATPHRFSIQSAVSITESFDRNSPQLEAYRTEEIPMGDATLKISFYEFTSGVYSTMISITYVTNGRTYAVQPDVDLIVVGDQIQIEVGDQWIEFYRTSNRRSLFTFELNELKGKIADIEQVSVGNDR